LVRGELSLKNFNAPIEEFYFLRIKNMWRYFKGQHFSFWMISFYLFFEYARPPSIFPWLDFLPWAQIFLIGSLVGAFVDPSVKWVPSPVNKYLIMFALAIFISSLFAYYPEISREHYFDFYGWFVIYFLIISIVNTKQRYYIFMIIFLLCVAKISIGTSTIWAARGFAFTSWGLTGPPGNFQNSGELAILMLTLFPLAFLLYENLKNKVSRIERYLLILFWLTPIITILGANSRGSQIALALQLIFMFRKNVFSIKKVTGIIIILSISYSFLPEEQMLRFSNIGEDRPSQQRVLYLEHGLDMLRDNPVLGVGYYNFARYYSEYYPNDMLYNNAQLPHNIFIQVGTDAGLLGLIPFLLIIWSPFSLIKSLNKRKEANIIICNILTGFSYGIFGFIVAGQFVSVTYYPFLWIGLAFMASGFNVLETRSYKYVK
jgi:putative inorganic carbon (HCO3(-)) transporter